MLDRGAQEATAAATLLRSVANELARIVCSVSGSWPSFRRGAILRGVTLTSRDPQPVSAPISLCGILVQPYHLANKVGEIAGLHSVHHPCAVTLDSTPADLKAQGNFLIGQTGRC
jgi:hypothetical protein